MLLVHLNVIEAADKLHLRNEIHNLVLKYAYPGVNKDTIMQTEHQSHTR